MLAPLLTLGFLAAAAPAAAAAAAAPAPPAVAPVAIERRVGEVLARRLPDGTLLVSPAGAFVFEPGPDEPGTPPAWFEFVLPAGTKREFAARTETLITVPKGVALELTSLVGDIKVEAWDKDAVRIVAEHGARDRLRTRVVEYRRQAAELRRQRGELRRDVELLRRDAEQVRRDAERARREAEAQHREPVIAGLHGGTLHVETLNRMGMPAVVDYTITVPRWMALRLSGMETDISVEGVRAAIAAESIRGDVVVRGGRGPVQISSVEGEVRAFDCDGEVQASSINRTVELDGVSGALVVESVNGDIRIGRVRSRSVEASSVNGSVIYRGEFEPRGRYRLASHAGNLFVDVPVGAGVDVSVATFEGAFRSGFPLEIGPWRKGQKFNFVLGTGGSQLELESFQGRIELLRPAEVPAVAPAPRVAPVPRAPKIVRIQKQVPVAPAPPAPEEDK
jgi:hypothetical protein